MSKTIAHVRGKADDLTVIKGIKETRQQLLRKALNIHTYDALAEASAAVVLAAFRAEGQPVTLASVEAWIAEAARLASTRAAQKREASKPSSAGDEWQPLGLFFVEFQGRRDPTRTPEYRTKIHHMETDTDDYLSGLDAADAWMVMAEKLSAEAPHLAAAMRTTVSAPGTTQTIDKVETPPAPDTATAPEARLHEVLARLQSLVQGESMPPTIAAAAPQASAHAETAHAHEAENSQLQRYLEKYGDGITPATQRHPATAGGTSVAAQNRLAAEPTTAASIKDAKLAHYLEKYGSA